MCFQHFLIITTSLLLEFVCLLVWYCCFMFLPEAYIDTLYISKKKRELVLAQQTNSYLTHVILARLSREDC